MHKHQLFFSHLQLYKQSAINGNIHRLGAESTKFHVDIPFINSILMTFHMGFGVFGLGLGMGFEVW